MIEQVAQRAQSALAGAVQEIDPDPGRGPGIAQSAVPRRVGHAEVRAHVVQVEPADLGSQATRQPSRAEDRHAQGLRIV